MQDSPSKPQVDETRQARAAARDDLVEQNAELARANQQLAIIHELALLLQAAPDLHTVQERVLQALTEELGFARALVGLMNPETQTLGDWQIYPPGGQGSPGIPLEAPDASAIGAILATDTPVFLTGQQIGLIPLTGRWLGLSLNLREHPVGVLLVGLDNTPAELSAQGQEMLQAVADQASIALGTTMVCIDRTRRLVVEQERNRIARDIHDTIAQSLFGMVFSLDACISMLPEQVDNVIQELGEMRDLASRVRDEVRQSIFDLWPGELTLERFKSDLNAYVSQCCRPHSFRVNFTTSGDFDRLSPLIRRTLYRIAQEALVNAARHSGAHSAQVCIGMEAGQVHLFIRDQGRGFDMQALGSRPSDQGGFGLSGIKTRVSALGGDSAVLSREKQGTIVLASLPCSYEGDGET